MTTLQALVSDAGQPAFRATQLADWLYKKRVDSMDAMKNLPTAFRESLAASHTAELPPSVRCLGSADTTRKYLLKLHDGRLVETVLIPASPALYGSKSDRRTLCVSSQVGCAYGCKFCASGLAGWTRNLSAGEIVGQILVAERESGERVNNLVFMGMGEPFANYEQLMRAIEIINAPWGIGLGARHMTISTSGLVPQIRKLADQPLQVRLAISLHGASNAVRSKIMPVNKKYPIEELLDACEEYTQKKKQIITFEYILIQGVNDAPEEALSLAAAARKMRAKVNLIPYNQVEGLEWDRPSEAVQDAFHAILQAANIPCTWRRDKGHDIAAACGQLRLQTEASLESV